MVNRIWQHLMGRGIVVTPNNFGFKSLLQLILNYWTGWPLSLSGGWSIKRIRMIVLSDTYKQSSRNPDSDTFMQIDPDNHLLWRRNITVDAEVLRDSLLQVSGDLNLKMEEKVFIRSCI